MDRRLFLLSSLGALASAGRAATPGSDRKLLVVFAKGGWDTTRVLSPMSSGSVDVEADGEPWTVGGLSLVDHPARPNVRAFFSKHASRCALAHGILVPSVAHETCVQLAMTGGTRGTADWAAIVGGLAADRYTLPHLVLDGPAYPAAFGTSTVRVGASGQLDGLLTGALVSAADGTPGRFSGAVHGALDRYLQRRSSARLATASAPESPILSAYSDALGRSLELEDLHDTVSFASSPAFEDRLDLAVSALSTGVSRAVSVAFPDAFFSWDTHSGNDVGQSPLWDQLFTGLSSLMTDLDATSGPSGAPLSDDVVVVVLSEMGRTPRLNGALGKDHWPYTSALLFGAGIPGGVTVGGYQGDFAGALIDPATGAAIPSGGVALTAAHLGATLLAAVGEDPGVWVPGYDPIPLLAG